MILTALKCRSVTGAVLAAFCTAAGFAQAQPLKIEGGAVRGVSDQGVTKYLGIPYAASPAGNSRWRPPGPVRPWKGVRTADHFGASCMQDLNPAGGRPPWTPEYLISGSRSEDCLFVNVWSPPKRLGKVPILFWIHGGGFREGGGDVPIYDGTSLAKRGIMVVSVNYRLGIYGFLAHPLLSSEAGGHSGNYGLMDQIAALRWLKRNAAAFGGDPARITIAGQSAGAASVHDLILSPQAEGLFRGAIAQSGSGMGIPIETLQRAEESGVQIAKVAGITTLADLRALPPERLSAALGAAGPSAGAFGPVADGYVLPRDPAAAKAGNYADTPILTGMVADEGSFVPTYRSADPDVYKAGVKARFNAFADRFLALYPLTAPQSSGPELSRDRGLASMLFWARQRLSTSRFPVFAYLFTHPAPGPESARFGAFHSSEIPYAFGTLDKAAERAFTEADRRLSAHIQAYWVNFIKTGNPNGSGLPRWEPLDRRSRVMAIGKSSSMRPAMSSVRMGLFEAYVASGGKLGLF